MFPIKLPSFTEGTPGLTAGGGAFGTTDVPSYSFLTEGASLTSFLFVSTLGIEPKTKGSCESLPSKNIPKT